MRFIVDLYRYLIYFYRAAIIIAVALAIFLTIDRSGPSNLAMDAILIGTAILSILILNLGGIAVLMSFHAVVAVPAMEAVLDQMLAGWGVRQPACRRGHLTTTRQGAKKSCVF